MIIRECNKMLIISEIDSNVYEIPLYPHATAQKLIHERQSYQDPGLFKK